MLIRWLMILVAAIVIQAACPAATSAADENAADRAALRTAQRELRNPDADIRVEGIRRLRDIRGVEAAKVLLSTGLTDSAPAVRRVAYRTLLAWKDDQTVAEFLLRTLNKELRVKKKGVSCFMPLAAILLASELPDIQRDVSAFLDTCANSHKGMATVIGVADELGAQNEASSVTSLCRMTELKCFADSFALRRAVVQAMVLIREPEAVDALVALLPKVDGEVRGDILHRLAAISEHQFGTDAKAWQAWWQKHKKGFVFPPESQEHLSSTDQAEELPSYYGLPLQARRIVFVIDISGSMGGPRLAAAQKELLHAIDALPERTSFNIVAFSHRTTIWRKTLIAATSQSKQAAKMFVYQLHAGGHTAAYDALEAAFGFDTEAVYFLSDGEPNAGKIPSPVAIVSTLTQTNRTRRISVNTIGISPGIPGGPLETFMTTLAEQNFGQYRRVGE